MALSEGTLLNQRYQVIEILAQGGMGSVYKALDVRLGVEVALKENLFTGDEYSKQFRREAIIMANLRHPNLPRVTDQFILEGRGQYLVMDFIEGEDLRQRIERLGPLNEEDVILIGAAVCEALSYLNKQKPPVIHRDIKPGNVKITHNGQIVLVDFGLAKQLHLAQVTSTGARAMTPGYSPPEQYGSGRTDHRSDIFSLGATLYAACTGEVPEDALARAMDQSILTEVRNLNPDISECLAAVIENSLKVDIEARFQSAAELKAALLDCSTQNHSPEGVYQIPPGPETSDQSMEIEDLLKIQTSVDLALESAPAATGLLSLDLQEVQSGQTDSRESRSGGRFSSGCWVTLAAIVVVLVISALAMTAFFPDAANRIFKPLFPGLSQDTAAPSPTLVSTETPDVQSTKQWELFASETAESKLTESSKTIVTDPTSSPSPTIEVPTVTFTDIPTGTLEPSPTLTPVGGGAGIIAFASDRDGSTQIYTIDVEGNNLEKVTDLPGGACQPDWSPDGSQLVIISPCEFNQESYPGSALFIINLDGSGLVPIPTVPGGDYDPSWSPDGDSIAFTSLRDRGREAIYLYSRSDGSVKSLSDIYSRDMQPDWSPDGSLIIVKSERRGVPQLWVMDPDGKNQEIFSKSSAFLNSHPDWSPDGKTILFTQLVAYGGIPRLALAPFEMESYTEYSFTQEQSPKREGVYSTDGFWIAYEGWSEGSDQNIFLMASNGALIQQVTTDPGADFDPAWNPNLPPSSN